MMNDDRIERVEQDGLMEGEWVLGVVAIFAAGPFAAYAYSCPDFNGWVWARDRATVEEARADVPAVKTRVEAMAKEAGMSIRWLTNPDEEEAEEVLHPKEGEEGYTVRVRIHVPKREPGDDHSPIIEAET